MAMVDRTPVMDVAPWPNGYGFEGSRSWWEYVMDQDEKQRLDNLMGVALLNTEVCERLVRQRDAALLNAFGISPETQAWLRRLQAGSLVELAQAITAHHQPDVEVISA